MSAFTLRRKTAVRKIGCELAEAAGANPDTQDVGWLKSSPRSNQFRIFNIEYRMSNEIPTFDIRYSCSTASMGPIGLIRRMGPWIGDARSALALEAHAANRSSTPIGPIRR